MAATYRKTPGGLGTDEVVITQRSLAFVGAVMGFVGAILSAGVAYGVMRTQLDAKVDARIHAEAIEALGRRISRDSTEVREIAREMAGLAEDVQDTKRRVTDIACDLIRPRKAYCR